MRAYEYKKIDAFTSGVSGGNPAACLYLKEGDILTDAKMQDIAIQHKGFVSEMVSCRSIQVCDSSHYAHTRVFAPKLGYLEDPATGSGNSTFGYYMLKNDMWKGEAIAIEQGGNNINYNTVKLSVKNDKVLFGGAATERIIGSYYI